MGWWFCDCFYITFLKIILTYDSSVARIVLLDADFNVTATSTLTSYRLIAAIDINGHLLYSYDDGDKYFITLVDSNLELIDQL